MNSYLCQQWAAAANCIWIWKLLQLVQLLNFSTTSALIHKNRSCTQNIDLSYLRDERLSSIPEISLMNACCKRVWGAGEVKEVKHQGGSCQLPLDEMTETGAVKSPLYTRPLSHTHIFMNTVTHESMQTPTQHTQPANSLGYFTALLSSMRVSWLWYQQYLCRKCGSAFITRFFILPTLDVRVCLQFRFWVKQSLCRRSSRCGPKLFAFQRSVSTFDLWTNLLRGLQILYYPHWAIP